MWVLYSACMYTNTYRYCMYISLLYLHFGTDCMFCSHKFNNIDEFEIFSPCIYYFAGFYRTNWFRESVQNACLLSRRSFLSEIVDWSAFWRGME